MKITILTAADSKALESKANAWFSAHDVHVRAINLSQGKTWALAVAYVETPDPIPAAEEWIGQQLGGRSA